MSYTYITHGYIIYTPIRIMSKDENNIRLNRKAEGRRSFDFARRKVAKLLQDQLAKSRGGAQSTNPGKSALRKPAERFRFVQLHQLPRLMYRNKSGTCTPPRYRDPSYSGSGWRGGAHGFKDVELARRLSSVPRPAPPAARCRMTGLKILD
jgi:hypothetical protein